MRPWRPLRTRETRRPAARPKREPGPHVTAHITRLVVELGNRADDWRGATVDAECAFRLWGDAAYTDRDKAAVAYLAATDREEQAASEYRRAWEACCAAAP
jgi:hypothetical protein